jgi:hypothetical protein
MAEKAVLWQSLSVLFLYLFIIEGIFMMI